MGIGADGGAGVSAASDTLLLSRNTAAELRGTDTAKKTVNGRNLAVTADQQSIVVTNADGVAGAGGIYGAGAVAATAAATKLDGSVTATMKNITSNNKGLDISAQTPTMRPLWSALRQQCRRLWFPAPWELVWAWSTMTSPPMQNL